MKVSDVLKAMCILALVTGCGEQPTRIPGIAPPAAPAPQTSPPLHSAEGARAHVQQYVDRLLGGDTSVKIPLLYLLAINLETIDSLAITSCVPAYSPEGEPIDGWYAVVLQVVGKDALARPISGTVNLSVRYRDGKWRIIGTNL